MTLNISKFVLFAFFLINQVNAQDQNRWQMSCKYFMDVELNTKKHHMSGTQTIILFNNSPDELTKVFYHLYFNAFQPGSQMDERSRTIPDPDLRVADRISKLKPEETGWHKIKKLKHNNQNVEFKIEETILEVTLNTPIKPGSVDTFYMEFESQVPLQIRRSGRDSEEGIDYSMSQWYPKMCNYDYQGWHANPYVAREFYGIWGDFDVKITLPSNYIIGASGYLQNKNEIGYGYEDKGITIEKHKKNNLTWHFFAPNVHDFFWGADPDYVHDVVNLDDTTQIHFLYQEKGEFADYWKKSQQEMIKAFNFIEKKFGDYPYRQYSFVQGGDGGMEYPMGTLITGKRGYGSLVGVMIHELMHTWYQMLLGTNEALYAWMDEGFTSYASTVVNNELNPRSKQTKDNPFPNIHSGSFAGYFATIEAGIEEPLTVHADHFMTNSAYYAAAYSKGAVFLHQLEYIIGKEALNKTLLEYYNTWRFRHPNVNDFIRIAEKVSGFELDWYKEYFVNTTHSVDYAVDAVFEDKNKTKVTLKRMEGKSKNGLNIGRMPLPIDLIVEYKDGKETKTAYYYIPLDLTRAEKKDESLYGERTILDDWWWTKTNYDLVLPFKFSNITKIIIDPSTRMADVKRDNNQWTAKQ
jgi:hypothetical protein